MFDFTRLEEIRRWRDEFARRFPLAWPAMQGGYERTAMVVDGYGASIMLAPRLEDDKDDKDDKKNHGLPPGITAPAYPVAPFEGCPSGWRRQRDAFFVPIPRDQHGKGPGMWYDWTMNDGHTHDLAVVPSTTGLNPITFQKANALRLERYSERCPVHEVAFEGDRFCQRCNKGKGLKWPPQNYVAAPNILWWDGFRRPDGTVRQFWFSDDVLGRDVGVAVLGADRVPAFGFAFFRSKEAKPVPAHRVLMRGGPMGGYAQAENNDGQDTFGRGDDALRAVRSLMGSTLGGLPRATGTRRLTGWHGPSRATPSSAFAPTSPRLRGASKASGDTSASPPEPPRPVGEIRREAVERTVAVGAGSGITQDLKPDPRSLDEWQDEPAAVITVYFVPEEVAVAILESPKRDLTGPREGALDALQRGGLLLGTE